MYGSEIYMQPAPAAAALTPSLLLWMVVASYQHCTSMIYSVDYLQFVLIISSVSVFSFDVVVVDLYSPYLLMAVYSLIVLYEWCLIC